MMRRSSVLTAGARVVLCALGASACGGSHRSATPVTSAQVVIATSTASSSTAPTTPLAATTTSSAPAPTANTTTAAPAATTTVASADELAVRATWKGWLMAGEACTVDAKNCDRSSLANYMAGAALSNKLKAVDTLSQKGWGVRKGPGGIDDRYKVDSVTIAADEATVQYCELDEGVTFDPGAGPGGADVIINDAVASHRSGALLTRSAGVWKVTGFTPDHQEEGRALWDSCVAG